MDDNDKVMASRMMTCGDAFFSFNVSLLNRLVYSG